MDLEQLQITITNTRKTRGGGFLLEVKGKDKADLLAAKLNEASVGTIRRPVQTERLLLLDLDPAITEEEIRRDLQKAVPGTQIMQVIVKKRQNRL